MLKLLKEIIISGGIGLEIEPADVRGQLDKLGGGDVEVVMSSLGGFVSAAFEMDNVISDYKRKNPNAQMSLKLSGLVASGASYISMNPAFALVSAEDNVGFMVHNAHNISIGDHHQMRKDADMLEQMSNIMAGRMVDKMKISENEAKALLDNETWFFGKRVVESGIADGIVDRPQGFADHSAASANSEISKFYAEFEKKYHAEKTLKAAASANSNNLKTKTEVSKEMDEKEIQAKVDAALKIEEDRIAALMAIKTRYAETPSAAVVSAIVDKAITAKSSVTEVYAEIVISASNGNTQAALESAGPTLQGNSGTISGEAASFTPDNDEGF